MPRPNDDDDERPKKANRRGRGEVDGEESERPMAKRGRRGDTAERDEDNGPGKSESGNRKSRSKSKLVLFGSLGAAVLLAVVVGALVYVLKPRGDKNYDVYDRHVATKPQRPLPKHLFKYSGFGACRIEYVQYSEQVFREREFVNPLGLKKVMGLLNVDASKISQYVKRSSLDFLTDRDYTLHFLEMKSAFDAKEIRLEVDFETITKGESTIYKLREKLSDNSGFPKTVFIAVRGNLLIIGSYSAQKSSSDEFFLFADLRHPDQDNAEAMSERMMLDMSGFDRLSCIATKTTLQYQFAPITIDAEIAPTDLKERVIKYTYENEIQLKNGIINLKKVDEDARARGASFILRYEQRGLDLYVQKLSNY